MQKSLSERLISFLGKPESNPDFQEFLVENRLNLQREVLGKIPTVNYAFPELGFTLNGYGTAPKVVSVCFQIFSTAITEGTYKAFTDKLPFDIVATNTRSEVGNKLGCAQFQQTPLNKPCEANTLARFAFNTWFEHYMVQDLKVTVVYRSADGDICELGVTHMPTLEKTHSQ